MIDLSRNQKSEIRNQNDTPIGVQILMLMPMVWAFWFLIERGL